MKKRNIILASALLVSAFSPFTTVKASNKVDEILSNMTLDQKIGQILMPDFRKWKQAGEEAESDFTVMNDEVKRIVDKYDLGGVILFAQNVKTTEQTLRLTEAFQQAAVTNTEGNGNLPLLLTIDQEGGIVTRLGTGTSLPGNMAIGATRSEKYAADAGRIIGRELSALGINTNFAPVLDVNNNPQNPVIGLRSFSDDPQLVGQLGTAMMKGMQEYNVITAAKHFPGHGDTATDSHVGLPFVDKTKEDLMKLELAPFKKAMAEGVDMIMTAHIQYPKLDSTKVISKKDGSEIFLPATLSKPILTDLVRKEMKYDGIIITDAMNMQAISDHFGEGESTVKAIQAGVDIVLMPTILRSEADLAKLDTIIANIKTALTDGTITEEMLNTAVKRVLKLKEKRGILNYANDTRTLEQKLAHAMEQVGSKQNRDLERNIAVAAVTIVKNEDNTLPFKLNADSKVLLLAAYNNEKPGMELSMRRLIAEGKIPNTVQFESFRYAQTTNFEQEVKPKIDAATHVIVISEINRVARLAPDFWLTSIPTAVVKESNLQNKPVAVLSISHPYDATNYPEAKAVVIAYGAKGMDPTEALQPEATFGPNIPAGVEVILGRKSEGKLPVNLPVINKEFVDGKWVVKYTNEIAIARDFSLMYQPKPQTATNDIVKVENIINDTAINVETKKADASKFKALEGKDVELYDITFTDSNGLPVDIGAGEYKVTLQKDVNKDIDTVFHVDEKGEIHSLAFTSTKDTVTFTAKHFSLYGVSYKTPVVVTNVKENVKTSDVLVVPFALSMIVSLAGLVILAKNKE